jgi:plasmid stabilization system protein ParE
MKLRFTQRAVENLNAIGDHLSERSPQSSRRVRTAIYATLQNLLLFPHAGRLQNVPGVRKIVTPRYGYLIYYTVDGPVDELVVLNIKHPAREREYQDV